MEGASDYEKASTVINCLDTASIDLVMPHLPSVKWTYLQAKTAITKEFGNSESIATRKMEFLNIQFQEDETLANFSERFYSSAQFLNGVNALSDFDAKIAMTNALKPHDKIHIAMLPALVNNYRTYELTQYLKRVGHKFTKPPTTKSACNSVRYSENNFHNPQASSSSYNRPYSPRYDNPSSKLEGRTPAPDLNNVVCHCCQKKGHYASSCPSASKNLFRFQKQMSILLTRNFRKDIMKNVQI